jgi:hypothetical protein
VHRHIIKLTVCPSVATGIEHEFHLKSFSVLSHYTGHVSQDILLTLRGVRF